MSIVIENCSFVYPSSGIGVHDVNISAEDGELVAVIGSSGSGKTTLLKLVAGFEQANSGRILINGRDVCGVPARLRNVGMVFQSYALFPLMTCAENVAYPLKIRKVPPAERRRKALDMLERVGLAAFADRLPSSMSAGSSSAWLWPAHWASTPTCFCSTNLFPRSTPVCAWDCAGKYAAFRRNRALPPCM